jgi:hypothetical protein
MSTAADPRLTRCMIRRRRPDGSAKTGLDSIISQGPVPRAARCPIPLSIRTCGCPAYDLPMTSMTWLHCLGQRIMPQSRCGPCLLSHSFVHT